MEIRHFRYFVAVDGWSGFRNAGPLHQLVDANAPRDHRQVRRQTAVAAKLPQRRVVVGDHAKQDLGRDILDVFGLQWDAAQMRRVVNNMIDQTNEPIHEVVPGARLAVQATLEEGSINRRQCHGAIPISFVV